MRLAIDLGGTHLRIAVGSSVGSWTHFHKERRGEVFSPDDLLERLRIHLNNWQLKPASIGVSVAAVVGEAGYLVAAENLGWSNVPLGHILRQAFSCPVVVETDVYCGAYYELKHGIAQYRGSAFYVSVGTGIGHAVIIDGKIWRGAHGAANALGHMVLQPDGIQCYCGHKGCLCTVASGRAQEQSNSSDKSPIEALAQAIASAVTLLEPEVVVLSGGALKQSWFDLRTLVAAISSFSYPAVRPPEVFLSEQNEPNLLGAHLLTQELKQ